MSMNLAVGLNSARQPSSVSDLPVAESVLAAAPGSAVAVPSAPS